MKGQGEAVLLAHGKLSTGKAAPYTWLHGSIAGDKPSSGEKATGTRELHGCG
jgi:hypothetical protein